MEILANEPFLAAAAPWQSAAGTWSLAVVCKITFVLVPDVVRVVTDGRIPLLRDDLPMNGDPSQSLHTACDLVPSKPLTDVVLVGRAYTPGGVASHGVQVRLVAGEIDKRIDVHCDRVLWQGRVLLGQPFTSMPVAYERAAGGPGTSNPVGISFDAPPDVHQSVRIANLQPPGTPMAGPGDRFAPIGFGPIAPHWPDRIAKLGGLSSPPTWRTGVLPRELKDTFWNCAPRDQQLRALRADEALLLENLLPSIPRLTTRLPGIAPRAVCTGRVGKADESLAMTAATLHLDTDRGVGTLTWLGRIALRERDETGTIVITERERREDPRTSVPTAAAAASVSSPSAALTHTVAAGASSTGDDARTVLASHEAARTPALPFQSGAVAQAPRVSADEEARTVTAAFGASTPLPFVEASSPWARPAPPRDTPPPRDPEDTGTLAGSLGREGVVLPFEGAGWKPPPQPLVRPLPPPEPPVVPPPPPAGVVPEAPLRLDASPSGPEPPAATPEPTVAEDRFPPERCGRITASIARARDDRSKILASHDLDDDAWRAIDRRVGAAIEAELAEGGTALLDAFDDGYVAQLADERGPLGAEDFARLLLAEERGQIAATLREMGLPRGAMMRLTRVFGRRAADDPDLDDDIDRALEALRTRPRTKGAPPLGDPPTKEPT